MDSTPAQVSSVTVELFKKRRRLTLIGIAFTHLSAASELSDDLLKSLVPLSLISPKTPSRWQPCPSAHRRTEFPRLCVTGRALLTELPSVTHPSWDCSPSLRAPSVTHPSWDCSPSLRAPSVTHPSWDCSPSLRAPSVTHPSWDCSPSLRAPSVTHPSWDCSPSLRAPSVTHPSWDCSPSLRAPSVTHPSWDCSPSLRRPYRSSGDCGTAIFYDPLYTGRRVCFTS